MPFVAGNDIQAHCPTCGKDTEHTVLDVQGGVVHQVRCKACASDHPYRRPKRPAKAKPAAGAKKRKPRKKTAPSKEPSWESLLEDRDPSEAQPYAIDTVFAEADLVQHSTFGLGVVTAVHDGGKIDVIFQDRVRKLVHGRM